MEFTEATKGLFRKIPFGNSDVLPKGVLKRRFFALCMSGTKENVGGLKAAFSTARLLA